MQDEFKLMLIGLFLLLLSILFWNLGYTFEDCGYECQYIDELYFRLAIILTTFGIFTLGIGLLMFQQKKKSIKNGI